MTTKQTDAQVKAQILNHINAIKGAAIYYGFDYPTNPIEHESAEALQKFLDELRNFVQQEIRLEMRKLIR